MEATLALHRGTVDDWYMYLKLLMLSFLVPRIKEKLSGNRTPRKDSGLNVMAEAVELDLCDYLANGSRDEKADLNI